MNSEIIAAIIGAIVGALTTGITIKLGYKELYANTVLIVNGLATALLKIRQPHVSGCQKL